MRNKIIFAIFMVFLLNITMAYALLADNFYDGNVYNNYPYGNHKAWQGYTYYGIYPDWRSTYLQIGYGVMGYGPFFGCGGCSEEYDCVCPDDWEISRLAGECNNVGCTADQFLSETSIRVFVPEQRRVYVEYRVDDDFAIMDCPFWDEDTCYLVCTDDGMVIRAGESLLQGGCHIGDGCISDWRENYFTLEAGWNRLRITFCERGGDDYFDFRITDSDGNFMEYYKGFTYIGSYITSRLHLNEGSEYGDCKDFIDNDGDWDLGDVAGVYENDGVAAPSFNKEAYSALYPITTPNFPDFGEKNIDCFDAGCNGKPGPHDLNGAFGNCNYEGEYDCNDGYDNDFDGLPDFADPDCKTQCDDLYNYLDLDLQQNPTASNGLDGCCGDDGEGDRGYVIRIGNTEQVCTQKEDENWEWADAADYNIGANNPLTYTKIIEGTNTNYLDLLNDYRMPESNTVDGWIGCKSGDDFSLGAFETSTAEYDLDDPPDPHIKNLYDKIKLTGTFATTEEPPPGEVTAQGMAGKEVSLMETNYLSGGDTGDIDETCTSQGGTECEAGQICAGGYFIAASDTTMCCYAGTCQGAPSLGGMSPEFICVKRNNVGFWAGCGSAITNYPAHDFYPGGLPTTFKDFGATKFGNGIDDQKPGSKYIFNKVLALGVFDVSSTFSQYEWEFEIDPTKYIINYFYDWTLYDTLEFYFYAVRKPELFKFFIWYYDESEGRSKLLKEFYITDKSTNDDKHEEEKWHHILIPISEISDDEDKLKKISAMGVILEEPEILELRPLTPDIYYPSAPEWSLLTATGKLYDLLFFDRFTLISQDESVFKRYYCAFIDTTLPADGHPDVIEWIDNLNNPQVCNEQPGYIWTGSQCCGDDLDETYNDGLNDYACWEAEGIPNDELVLFDGISLLNWKGEFYGCGLSADEITTVSSKISGWSSANNINTNCYHFSYDVLNSKYYCDVGTKEWRDATVNHDESIFPEGIFIDAEKINLALDSQNCCPSAYCWNGSNCVQNRSPEDYSTPTLEDEGYNCIDGVWSAYYEKEKYDDASDIGYCDANNKCWDGSDCVDAGTYVDVDPEDVFIDYYCKDTAGVADWVYAGNILIYNNELYSCSASPPPYVPFDNQLGNCEIPFNRIKNYGFDGSSYWTITRGAVTSEDYLRGTQEEDTQSLKLNFINSYADQQINVIPYIEVDYVGMAWVKGDEIDMYLSDSVRILSTMDPGTRPVHTTEDGWELYTFEFTFKTNSPLVNFRIFSYGGTYVDNVKIIGDTSPMYNCFNYWWTQNPYVLVDGNPYKSTKTLKDTKKTDPDGIEGCCPAHYCYDGAKPKCRPSGDLLDEGGGLTDFICADGLWSSTDRKYNWKKGTERKSGFCSEATQCYSSDTDDHDMDSCVDAGTYMNEELNPSTGDHYCEAIGSTDSVWSSRTKLIAVRLLEYAEDNKPYSLYCSGAGETLNDLTGVALEFGTETNNFCVLKYDNNKITFGTSVNTGGLSNVLVALDVNVCNYAMDYNDGKYHGCANPEDKVSYNKRTNSIIYGEDNIGTSSYDDSWSAFTDLLKPLFVNIPPNVNIDSQSFNQLYVYTNGGGTKTIAGITGRNTYLDDFMFIEYSGFTDNVCSIVDPDGIGVCTISGNVHTLYIDDDESEYDEFVAKWPDLTAKLRIT